MQPERLRTETDIQKDLAYLWYASRALLDGRSEITIPFFETPPDDWKTKWASAKTLARMAEKPDTISFSCQPDNENQITISEAKIREIALRRQTLNHQPWYLVFHHRRTQSFNLVRNGPNFTIEEQPVGLSEMHVHLLWSLPRTLLRHLPDVEGFPLSLDPSLKPPMPTNPKKIGGKEIEFLVERIKVELNRRKTQKT